MYILRELTKKHKDLWVKVVDSDGEFLLIEAAGALPLWLEPEVADNRVCLSKCPVDSYVRVLMVNRCGSTRGNWSS